MNTTHLHGGFPNKETILSAMGFSEVPTTVDISHALYFIICNSCWFNDIQNILGRKPISGDVFELPHLKDDFALNELSKEKIFPKPIFRAVSDKGSQI